MAPLLLDGLLAGLLIATIGYAIVLDRRLRAFRQSRDEMQALLTSFTAATVHAQSSMATLRDASQTTSADLKEQLDRGKSLRDDLAFLVEHGTTLADRLESGIAGARAATKAGDGRGRPAIKLAAAVGRRAPQLRPEESAADAPPPSDAARELLRALKAAR